MLRTGSRETIEFAVLGRDDRRTHLLSAVLPSALMSTSKITTALIDDWEKSVPVPVRIPAANEYRGLPANDFDPLPPRSRKRSDAASSSTQHKDKKRKGQDAAPLPTHAPCCVCLVEESLSAMMLTPCGKGKRMCRECIEHMMNSHLRPEPPNRPDCNIPCPCACGVVCTEANIEGYQVFFQKVKPQPPASSHSSSSSALAPAAEEEKKEAPWLTVFKRAVRFSSLQELANTAIKDSKGVDTMMIFECPSCQEPTLLTRSEQEGIPLFVKCVVCNLFACTGCKQAVEWNENELDSDWLDDDVPEFIPQEKQHHPHRNALHLPAVFTIDFGPKNAKALAELLPSQISAILRTVNAVILDHMAGSKCPKCKRVAAKDDACTHLTCDSVGGLPGCKVSFCFCCGGLFAKSAHQYREMLKSEDHTKLALVSHHFTLNMPASAAEVKVWQSDGKSPVDMNLIRGDEAYIPPSFHNDGWQLAFNIEDVTCAGRCPNSLSSLKTCGAWFTPPANVGDNWFVERWTEFRTLRALHTWMEQHSNPTLMREILAHSLCVASTWTFVQGWAAFGFIRPHATLPYHSVVGPATTSSPASTSSSSKKVKPTTVFSPSGPASVSASSKITDQTRSAWSKRHLEWQRWVLACIPPPSASPPLAVASSAQPIEVDDE